MFRISLLLWLVALAALNLTVLKYSEADSSSGQCLGCSCPGLRSFSRSSLATFTAGSGSKSRGEWPRDGGSDTYNATLGCRMKSPAIAATTVSGTGGVASPIASARSRSAASLKRETCGQKSRRGLECLARHAFSIDRDDAIAPDCVSCANQRS